MAVFNVWRKDIKKLNNLKIFEIIIRVHNTVLAQVIDCENLLFGPLGEAIAVLSFPLNFKNIQKTNLKTMSETRLKQFSV